MMGMAGPRHGWPVYYDDALTLRIMIDLMDDHPKIDYDAPFREGWPIAVATIERCAADSRRVRQAAERREQMRTLRAEQIRRNRGGPS